MKELNVSNLTLMPLVASCFIQIGAQPVRYPIRWAASAETHLHKPLGTPSAIVFLFKCF